MSLASELANALTEPSHAPKTEDDSNYEGDADFNQDLDMDKKPDEDEEPMSPQDDTEMEDLFGDDGPAEVITHSRERYVIQCFASVSVSVLSLERAPQGHNARFA